ncbi:DUF3231 family protein [Texcoconibacillus texcoconensis]|nr:DUF3231 family protein [Texcoconibacillus texcoconensis]
MPNPFEAFWQSLKQMTDSDVDAPMHVGEVMNCWTYLAMMKEMLRYEEAGLNMTSDEELRDMLTNAHKLCQSQAEQMEAFLIKEGVQMPESPAPKPQQTLSDIPAGIHISDDELANGVSIKVAAAIIESATGQSQAIRTDLGMMWAKMQSEMLTFSTTLKSLMKHRGWVKVPPYYQPSGNRQKE